MIVNAQTLSSGPTCLILLQSLSAAISFLIKGMAEERTSSPSGPKQNAKHWKVDWKCMSWAQQTYILVFFVWLNSCLLPPSGNEHLLCVHGLRGRSMVVKGILLEEWCFMAYRPSSGLQAAQGKTISGHLLVVLCCVTNSRTCMCYENDTLNSPLSNLQEICGVVQERTFPNSSGSSCCLFLIIKRAYTPFSDTPLWAPSTVST